MDTLIQGDCGKFTNCQFTKGAPRQYGYFTDPAGSLGFTSGVVISTGNVDDLGGTPANQNDMDWPPAQGGGDPDLDALLNGTANSEDAVVLEFDFTAQTGDVSFDYVFLSEEYPEYVGTSYNDVFGFFISGPGITPDPGFTGKNMALVPGTTTYVGINSVNSGCSAGVQVMGTAQTPSNAQYYVDNADNGLGGGVTNNNTIFDGYTTVLTAEMTGLTPCQIYHMKLVLGDAGDGIYDSGVLLKTNSFGVGSNFQVSSMTTQGVDGDAVEGCDAQLIFSIPEWESDDKEINFTISGTATAPDDYDPITSPLIIPSGQTSTSLDLTTIMDGISEGTETIIIATDTGCVCDMGPYVYTLNLIDVDPLVLDIPDTIICVGDQATLDASIVQGGEGTFTYQWDNGLGNDSVVQVSPTGATTYNVTVIDECGNTVSDDVTVTPYDPQYTETIVPTSCGASDGEIDLTASGGFGNYVYSINGDTTNQTSGLFTGLSGGTYNIVITDDLGCQETGVIDIPLTANPVLDSFVVVNVSCAGYCDGSIAVNATGMTSFSIDNGANYQASNTFNDLCIGNYTIIGQDDNGCSSQGNTVVTAPDSVELTLTSEDVLCNGACDGKIFAVASGGTPGYNYSLDGGTTIQAATAFNDVCDGTYDVTAIDANGCTVSEQIVIDQPNVITWTFGVTDASCGGVCDGIINCIPQGGTSPYSYAWSPASVSLNQPLLIDLCPGFYDLTVEDANGCVIDTTGIEVSSPATVAITDVQATPESCYGACDGTITINATDAAQYSIDGNTWQASNVFTGLCAGNYVAYAQDVNLCEDTEPIEVQSPSEVVLTVLNDTTICQGGTADLQAIASGGAGNYTFAWVSGETAQNISVSPTTTSPYCVTAFDANNCPSSEQCVIVTLNDALSVQAFVDQLICEGDDASLDAIAAGGDGTYTYTWDQGVGVGNAQTVSPTVTTEYTVTVNDGCETPTASASVTVTVAAIPNIAFTADTLEGCVPLTVTFSEVNVPQGSTCLWSFGDGTVSQDCGVVQNTYDYEGCWDVSLNITTAQGCDASFAIQDYICTYGIPEVNFLASPDPVSEMDPTVHFNNQSIGAYSYEWVFDTENTAGTDQNVHPSYLFNSEPGEYEVCLTAISEEGCLDNHCDTVEVRPEMLVYVPNAFTPSSTPGTNDVFVPVVSGVDPQQYEFLVFNRWGQLIFSTEHIDVGWDGYYKNKLSQTDAYVWKLRVVDLMKYQPHEFVGHVVLLK